VVIVWLDLQPNAMYGNDEKFAEVLDSYLEKGIGPERIYTAAQMNQRLMKVR